MRTQFTQRNPATRRARPAAGAPRGASSNLAFNVKQYGALGDGATDDSTAIQAAIDAAELVDGTVLFPPAIYAVASETDVTTVAHVRLIGYGATLLATGTSMNILRTKQDNTVDSRCEIRGLTFDGNDQTSVTGLKTVDTNATVLHDVTIKDCPTTGWLLTNETSGKWTELCEAHSVAVTGCGTGVKFLVNGGNNSFNLTKFYHVTVSDSTTGVDIGQNCNMNRGYLDIAVWLNNDNDTGFSVDGNIEGMVANWSIESFSSTGTVGIDIGNNLDRGDFDYDLHLFLSGAMGTEISEGTGETLAWREGLNRVSGVAWSPLFGIKDNDNPAESLVFLADGILQWNEPTTPTYNVARLQAGSGTPESAVSAPVGSLYMRTDGGAGTSLYVKESGTGNTGWVGK